MRIGLCFAEAAATARAAVGRTAVAFGPDNAMGHGPDDGTGNEAKGIYPKRSCAHVVGEVGGIGVRGSKHSHGSDFTPKHCSAYVVGFRPPSVTSQVVQRTRATLLWTMEPSEVGRKRGQQCRFSAAAVQLPFHQDIISALAAAMQSKAKLEAGQQRAALLAQHNEAYSKATYHSIPSGTEAQAQPAAECSN